MKKHNKSMVIHLCFLFKGSASDKEVGPFVAKSLLHLNLESKVDNIKVKDDDSV